MPGQQEKREGGTPQAAIARRWSDGIAIVGMSARFPRSRNVQEFWARLLAGEILISEFSSEQLRSAGVDDATLLSPDYVRRGSVIDDADGFDAEFFGISRREAEIMDPQQRVFLECAWEAFEHAGYTGSGERVGVFAGAGMNTYVLQLLNSPSVLASAGGYQMMLANDKDFLATRVAYKMNLRGPAVSVQTACSTSLAAVHLACQSILAGECDMALAGGVSIPFPQGTGYLYIPGMILSPDGYCRPFDADAAGTVPGRGAGVVVLKRLSQAVADEDLIYAVIRGSAWNNDGAGKVGYTAPSIDGQAAVIREALAAAGVAANRIGYVEAHGTATELGDPIEVAALTSVFAESGVKTGSCVLGAVKANMGHANVAAGVAGLIKATLVAQSGMIPPTPNFRESNPSLALDKGPFVVNSSLMPWATDHESERWAAVSSFGIGGTNVHVILSEAPLRPVRPATKKPRVFPISARTTTALSAACDRLAGHLEREPSLSADEIAATLQLGRREFAARRAFVADDCLDLAELLRKPVKSPAQNDLALGRNVVFLFPGQGQQFVGMAAALYRENAAFRRTIERGASILRAEYDLDVVPMIAGVENSPALKERLKETSVAQPVLFLVEYALAVLWRSLGVIPTALLGHSLGELTAATVAGVFSFESGVRLAAERGRLMAQTPPGIMLAVMLPPAKLADYFDQDVWLAAENGPKMSVASGLVDAVEDLERRLAADRIASVRLASKNAFHTPLMAEAAKAFRQQVEKVERRAPAIPWLSNVTGTWIEAAEAQSPQYWADQILARVRFTQNLSVLSDRSHFLLEVGPGEALLGMARQQLVKSVGVPSLGAENRRASDQRIFLEAAARAWECGVSLEWRELDPASSGRRCALPTYPFERQRYWIDAAAPAVATTNAPDHRLEVQPKAGENDRRADIASWFYVPSWQSTPPASIALPRSGAAVDCWLVLLDRSGLGEALASGLRSSGVSVITVAPGDDFAHTEDMFVVNPARPGDYEQMWQSIAALSLRPTGLLDLWTMRAMKVNAYESLVLLLQAARAHRLRFHQLEIVTDRLESVSGEPVEEVERAEVLGLAQVIPLEYEGTQCRSIDVHLPEGEIDPLARQILDEIQRSGPGSARGLTVAYRSGIRWQKGWTPAPLPPSSAQPFREAGVYLITGGAGGIGYSIARHLLQNYGARVVVTGRTQLPPRSEWSKWVASHDNGDATTRRILRMQELERSGGEVHFLSADVGSHEAMSEVLAQTRVRFGSIDGVLHAAGVAGGGMIASQSVGEAAAIRYPKVQGSMVLAELLREEKLDFFLLCSSISAAVPAAGQAAYAAANVFQNSFAAYCRSTLKLPALAIGFDAWQEVGMAAEMVLPEGFESLKEERLRIAMSTGEGIEVIRRCLTQWHGAQILTSTVDLGSIRARALAVPAAGDRQSISPVVQEEELEAVIGIWKELLGVQEIAAEDNFFELGGHSLMGTMVAARIRDRFGVSLTLRTLFEASTPQALAAVLRSSRESIVDTEVLVGQSDEDREMFEI
jgi:phthiocerol/phenolphthiocerol synthesis type-I polyketide synthase E